MEQRRQAREDVVAATTSELVMVMSGDGDERVEELKGTIPAFSVPSEWDFSRLTLCSTTQVQFPMISSVKIGSAVR